MTTARQDIGKPEWWTRPPVVLPLVATIVLIVALLTPQPAAGRFGDARLSSRLAGSLGARVLADLSGRLGWRVMQDTSESAPLKADGRTIHAVLSPPLPVTAEEAHRYLEAVRNGDALLLALDDRTLLSDSLGVTHFARGGYLRLDSLERRQCAGRRDLTPSLWPDGRVHLWGLRWLRGVPSGQVTFATLIDDERGGLAYPGDAAVGFPLGLGRVAVVADPDLLRNDVIRRCAWEADLITVRMLEWLRAGGAAPRTTLVFDEYHQGYGSRASVFSLTGTFLMDHPVGRTLLQVIVAALVLLMAVAPRALAPQDQERIERRDPMEQVDALAHAYEQVRGTRTITGRLLRGVRSRVDRGAVGGRAGSDLVFLESTSARAPARRDDVALVRRALLETVPLRDFSEVGAALRRIEDTLTTPPP